MQKNNTREEILGLHWKLTIYSEMAEYFSDIFQKYSQNMNIAIMRNISCRMDGILSYHIGENEKTQLILARYPFVSREMSPLTDHVKLYSHRS